MADLKVTPEAALVEAQAILAEELARAKVALVEIAQKAMRDSALAIEARKSLPLRGDDLASAAALALVVDYTICQPLRGRTPLWLQYDGTQIHLRAGSHTDEESLPLGRYRFLLFALPLDGKAAK